MQKNIGISCTRGWAHAGPKWVGPSWAQVGGPTPGPSGVAQAVPKCVGPNCAQVGPSWAQARNLGPQKIQKVKFFKIQIRSAQNAGKVWLRRKKIFLALFGPIFCVGWKNTKKIKHFVYFPWWANGCGGGL